MAKKKETKDDWKRHADTTLAHERGSMAKAQLKAEGRTFSSGEAQLRDDNAEKEDDVERAQAKPDAERAVKKPSKAAKSRKKK